MLSRLILVAVVVSAGCGSTAVRPERPAVGGLPDSAVAAMHLDRGRARQLGTFHGRGVWVAPTETGETCLLDTAADAVGGACGQTLFGAHRLAFTEATDGGPPPRPVTLVRITGVVAPGVRSLGVELSDGSSTSVVPNAEGAFVYDEPVAQLAAGAAPVALVARNAAARPVDRIDLPRAPLLKSR